MKEKTKREMDRKGDAMAAWVRIILENLREENGLPHANFSTYTIEDFKVFYLPSSLLILHSFTNARLL
jgi:hypothetical protein